VLHDLFGMTFADIAVVVGRTPSAVRQLAGRARKHVRDGAPRLEVDAAQHRTAVTAFIQAAAGGDPATLLTALDPQVVLTSDGGGVVTAARRPVYGADRVARFIIGVAQGRIVGGVACRRDHRQRRSRAGMAGRRRVESRHLADPAGRLDHPSRHGAGTGQTPPPRGHRIRSGRGRGRRGDVIMKPRVIVVGSGFAGFFAARTLERLLPAGAADPTVVSATDHLCYSPLLPEVAAGRLDPRRIAIPLHGALHRARILQGMVDQIDFTARTAGGVEHDPGPDDPLMFGGMGVGQSFEPARSAVDKVIWRAPRAGTGLAIGR
jgi:hypothetical protein